MSYGLPCYCITVFISSSLPPFPTSIISFTRIFFLSLYTTPASPYSLSYFRAVSMNGTNSSGNGVHQLAHYTLDDSNSNSSDRPSSPTAALTERGLDRNELVRIIVQAIDELGYPTSARLLENEAGVKAMSQQMQTLRDCILLGKWDQLESVLEQVTVFKSDADARAARFVLYEQKFLELLEAGHTADALECLRNDLTRLSPDPKLLHKLPLLCMCTTPLEVRNHADWPGAGLRSRTAVLEKLQRYIPASELLQENRLENLLCQTLEQQKRCTMFPDARQGRVSLLEDMVHCEVRVPSKILYCLEGHTDEVLFVQFSHQGEFLASASKDSSVIIWKSHALEEGHCSKDEAIFHRLQGHSEMVSFLSWSPCDKRLLSCGDDRTIRLWNVQTGECAHIFEKHTNQITACAWMPGGKTFVSGAHDFNIFEWNADTGECISWYDVRAHVNDIAVSKDGRMLIATCSNNFIRIFDTRTKEQISSMKESANITSIFLSNDANFLLVNNNSQGDSDMEGPEIHIWSLREKTIIETFEGFKQTRFVIRSCFGGHNQMLVLCGSEDHLVHIWKRRTGDLIAQLRGHEGSVNTVACSEANENLFASGSDDKTVIIWGVADLLP